MIAAGRSSQRTARYFLPLFAALFVTDAIATWSEADEPSAQFPAELVDFVPYDKNPIFAAEGAGHWDEKIRERGWIEREGDLYRMWFTGYDGTREGRKMLGYATSRDGLVWQRAENNPIYREHWVEDVMLVRVGATYYMFAEGERDRAQLLTSPDGLAWTRIGTLDIRYVDGRPLSDGAYGTPTAWHEDGTWYLLYERSDLGVWLASSRDLKTWTNVQDEPVMLPGPAKFDNLQIAVNQVIRQGGRYYAYYHGSGTEEAKKWCTCIAVSDDRVHWTKYSKNPLLRDNQSSGILVNDGKRNRLYSMHEKVQVHFATEGDTDRAK